MKRYIKCSHLSNDAKADIESLSDEYLYQAYDNDPEQSLDEVIVSVLDHVIDEIVEISPEAYSPDIVDAAKRRDRSIVDVVTAYVVTAYDDYDWMQEV